MHISIVTGTYNRLESLIAMVQSVRVNMPPLFAYEIIAVDGGSTDGTQAWCKSQPDIKIIEQKELLGAIIAFDTGAAHAQGDYVIMANDDITFHPKSILKAFTYLETHPTIGAVAFMDNRPMPGVDPRQYKAQLQTARNASGDSIQVIYAQVGMFRRWLGQKAGWWGSADPIMATAKTYGGDNYLSSRIWEMGYSVDIVEGVQVSDHVAPDTLRQINRAHNDRAFWKRYPKGPQLAAAPTVVNPQTERLRILYLPIYEVGAEIQRDNKRGLKEALARRGLVIECDWLGVKFDYEGIIDAFQPHIMLTQFHDPVSFPVDVIDRCRAKCPDMLILNWNGDARGLTDEDYLVFLGHFDAQLVVNAAALPVYEKRGIPAHYWQIGIEEPLGPVPDVQPIPVVFLGNCYNEHRAALEKALLSTGREIAFYGDGWANPAGRCLYDFATGEGIYRAADIAIGDTFSDGKTEIVAFVSNRVFQALAAGVFLLQEYSPELEKYTGLIPGVHYVQWKDFDELKELIDLYADEPEARRKIAEVGQAFVREHFSFDALVKQLLVEIIPEVSRVTA